MLCSWLIDLANVAIFIHLLGKVPIDMTRLCDVLRQPTLSCERRLVSEAAVCFLRRCLPGEEV